MTLEKICAKIVELEREQDVNSLLVKGIHVWPLVRHCLWVRLCDEGAPDVSRHDQDPHFFLRWLKFQVRRAGRAAGFGTRETRFPPRMQTLLISRTSCFQRLPSGKLFDRIVDPLAELLGKDSHTVKTYLEPLPTDAELQWPSELLLPDRRPVSRSEWSALEPRIRRIATASGIDADSFVARFESAWESYRGWLGRGRRLFRGHPDLKRIYVNTWYFPDMMGLITAAKEFGVETIDLQHGKQGRFQTMYSWFTCIPENGYAMLPDRFWCWGQPSCDHILATSPGRRTHRPFIGGYPWLWYYRAKLAAPVGNQASKTTGGRVLVTLQGRAGAHIEPIPQFLVDFLLTPSAQGAHFKFRCHPNFPECPGYVRARLAGVASDRYTLSSGTANLYDELLDSTHHITAFSSCVYEAEAFGVPSLLFGADAEGIYAEEIREGRFEWTKGTVADVERWLKAAKRINVCEGQPYIESSLETALRALGK